MFCGLTPHIQNPLFVDYGILHKVTKGKFSQSHNIALLCGFEQQFRSHDFILRNPVTHHIATTKNKLRLSIPALRRTYKLRNLRFTAARIVRTPAHQTKTAPCA